MHAYNISYESNGTVTQVEFKTSSLSAVLNELTKMVGPLELDGFKFFHCVELGRQWGGPDAGKLIGLRSYHVSKSDISRKMLQMAAWS